MLELSVIKTTKLEWMFKSCVLLMFLDIIFEDNCYCNTVALHWSISIDLCSLLFNL
jgi:hypothetical protein